YRSGRNTRRPAQLRQHVRVLQMLGVVKEFEKPPCIGCTRVPGKWRTERDHATHILVELLGKLARVDPAEAPADQAHARAVPLYRGLQQRAQAFEHAVTRPEVESLLPG